MEYLNPDPPVEQWPEVEGDGAEVRSGANVGADGDIPEQTEESAGTTAGPSEN